MRPEYTVHVADAAYTTNITLPCDNWNHAQAHRLAERMLTAAQDAYDTWRKEAS